MHFDEILLQLGKFGKYQLRTYVLLCIPAIPCALHMLVSVFIAAVPEHRCAIPGFSGDTFQIRNETHQAYINAFIPINDDGTVDKCNVYSAVNFTWAAEIFQRNLTLNLTDKSKCSSWVYDTSIFQKTVVTQFNLVCADQGKATLATVVFMGGVLAGAAVFGVMSDAIGRKKTLLISILLLGAAGVATAFSPNYTAFVILRFIIGTANPGVFLTAFVVGMEFMVPSMRLFAGIVIEFFFAAGYIILTGMAYLLRDWMWLQLACSLPCFLLLSYGFFVPESARWLIARGRKEEAAAIVQHAAKVNGVTLPDKLFDGDDQEGKTLTFKEIPRALIKAPTLLVRCLIVFFNWAVVAMVYYGLTLNSGNLGGDIFFNFLLSGLIEFPGYAFCFACKCLGRKGPHVGNMILGGVACISTIFIVLYMNSNNDWLIALSMIGKFGATVGFAIIYFWSAEIFPTVCRNGLMGMSSMVARVGSMAAAPIADLGRLAGGTMGVALPQIVFGVLTIAAGLLALFLPETAGKELPETIEDGNNFGKVDKSASLKGERKDICLVPSDTARDPDHNAYTNSALDMSAEDENIM